MKRALLLALLIGCGSAETGPKRATVASLNRTEPASGRPAAIQVEGVPAVPEEITTRLAQYQNMRGASFEDWGPDGSILISTRFAETSQLHLVPFPGGRREQITFTEEPVGGGVWIPGTPDFLYTQSRGGDENHQIYRLDRKKGRSILLTDGKSRNSMGPISRKGDRIVYSSNRRNGRDMDLYLLELAGGTSSLLLEAKGAFWSVTDWSPGDEVLMMLKVVSVNDTRPYFLSVSKPVPELMWSGPEDQRISCSSPKFAAPAGIWIMGCDRKGEFRQLTHYTGKSSLGVPWLTVIDQPWDVTDIEVHDRHVAYSKNEDGTSKIYFLGEDRPLDLPVGVVSGLRFSRDGKQLGFTLSRPDAPSDVYTWETEDKKLVRWTYSETGGLDPSTFVTPQRFSFKTFDDRQIPAYLYRPREAKKAPVVISIHGGPESQYRPSFSGLTQYWVNELGLAVIAPNVRGSTGYGKTYVALDNAEKRLDAVKDIGALLDWIATQPGLDASRVAVHGGSYGGFMVLASLVHHGDRIKAGVDIVGIGNFVTFLEKTSGYRVDLRRVEYGDERKPGMRAFFEKISPANHADRIRSALLVAHGRNDPRVPFFEAEQIAARVRAQGRPVWTVYADNEGHGFARKENRDYLTAVTSVFFQDHLLK